MRIKYVNSKFNLRNDVVLPIALLVIGMFLLAQCAPAAQNLSPTPSQNAPATNPSSAPTTPTTIQGTPTFSSASATNVPPATQMPVSTMTNSPIPQTTPTTANQLVYALEHALAELNAQQNANTLQDAQTHSQLALNILVGSYGRWYSKAIKSPLQNDAILKRGVLPGEKIPAGGADLDPLPEFPHGLALLTMGTATTPSQPLTVILGDVKVWQTQPRAGYDAIQNAIDNADAKNMQLGKLEGSVPRAAAWLRLALTNAPSPEQAHAFATQARTELESALVAAKQIAQ